MKFNTCLLGLLIALVLLLDHFCYGDGYFTDSECTPNDVMNNCNSTDCVPGIYKNANGDERCAVFWEGDDEPIPFRVCRKKTNGTVEDICTPADLTAPLQKVKCKGLLYKICSDIPPSGGNGCHGLVHDCNCVGEEDGVDNPEVNQTCTDP